MVRTHHQPPLRAGVILLVVVVMLALFAVIGLSFVLYSESEASNSRIYREAQVQPDSPSSDFLLSWALGQLIYGDTDEAFGTVQGNTTVDGFDVKSAMRGHDLARLMYGWNYVPNTAATRPLAPTNDHNNNVVAFNGSGATANSTHAATISYQFFSTEGAVIDPERNPTPRAPGAAPGAYAYPFNAPYTYPDRNNMPLAAVNADGQVMLQSFFRKWLTANPPGGPIQLSLDPADGQPFTNWTNTSPAFVASARHLTLRPLTGDMYFNPANSNDPHNFPAPQAGGDVKNLAGAPGGNDSIWMDLGFPVQTTRLGQKYKPLFAFLIVDLDNRVNINVHGNVNGFDPANPFADYASAGLSQIGHASDQGLGKHEVNLGSVFSSSYEWTHLLAGRRTATSVAAGRYGFDGLPGPLSVVASPTPFYPSPTTDARMSYLFPLDFDGRNETVVSGGIANTTTRFQTLAAGTFRAFPDYGVNKGYGNMTQTAGTDIPSNNERYLHPLLNNFLVPQGGPLGGDQPFAIDNMYHLIGSFNSRANDYQNSWLYINNLVRATFDDLTPFGSANTPHGIRIRNLITTHSYDLDVPGAVAWVTANNPADPNYSATAAYTWPTPAPSGVLPYPSGAVYQPLAPAATPATGDYVGMPFPTTPAATPSNDRRVPVLSRLDLNRKLTSYFDTTGTFQNGTPPSAFGAEPAKVPGFFRAQWERQQFAKDIFDRLLKVTGVQLPGPAGSVPTPALDAQRWLAQLAVNIVDYIDDDDFITPFYWNLANDPSQIVYGTECPKLVVNEAYAEIRNDPSDTDAHKGARNPYKVNFWLELLDPHTPAADSSGNAVTDPNTGLNRAAVQLQRQVGANPPTSVYQILVTNAAQLANDLGTRSNTLGGALTPNSIKAKVTAFNWAGAPVRQVLPTDGQFKPTQPNGFYVMAPDNTTAGDIESAVGMPAPTARIQNNFGSPNGDGSYEGLSYPIQQDSNPATITNVANTPHAVVLQRLACPLIPPQTTNPTSPDYNPYVTVDVLPYVRVNDAVQFMANPDPTFILPAPTGPNYMPVQSRVAQGRKEPYAAAFVPSAAGGTPPAPDPIVSQVVDQPAAAGGGQQPHNTFFQHNAATQPTTASASGATLTQPFDWLVHLDRPLVSPMELFHVSMVTPSLLTQSFIQAPPTGSPPGTPPVKYRHTAPWSPIQITDPISGQPQSVYTSADVQAARIYRALEYFTVGDRSIPSPTGGRLPGMVNINTIWDIETFRALCSAYDSTRPGFAADGHFVDQHVELIWNEILKTRTPRLAMSGGAPPPFQAPPPTTPGFGLSQADSPFWSFAGPGIAAGTPLMSELSLTRTALNPASPPQTNSVMSVFAPVIQPGVSGVTLPGAVQVGQHPYLLNEVLTKIAPHITTRSNVFAVYLTVGFFEVMDDTTTPPKLGAEIQTTVASNSDVAKTFRRRQMFAIVDRTNLALDNPDAILDATNATFRLRQARVTPFHLSCPVSVSAPTAVGGTVTQIVPVPNGIVASDASGPYLIVQYDGNSIPFHPIAAVPPKTPDLLWADTGINQEAVQVTRIDPAGVNDPNYPTMTVIFKNPHAAGFRLSNVQLGNPGPQGPIDFTSPQYKSVVPYAFIIQ